MEMDGLSAGDYHLQNPWIEGSLDRDFFSVAVLTQPATDDSVIVIYSKWADRYSEIVRASPRGLYLDSSWPRHFGREAYRLPQAVQPNRGSISDNAHGRTCSMIASRIALSFSHCQHLGVDMDDVKAVIEQAADAAMGIPTEAPAEAPKPEIGTPPEAPSEAPTPEMDTQPEAPAEAPKTEIGNPPEEPAEARKPETKKVQRAAKKVVRKVGPKKKVGKKAKKSVKKIPKKAPKKTKAKKKAKKKKAKKSKR
jgi:hypothetical protein